jgi:DNA-binding transcriptional ArsR family regulator
LTQVRLLADPLRLKILGAFGRTPRTTKQVAVLLGEKPTKLYHHVEALERAGLLVLKETRPNRGTLEKYYQAVATRIQVGPSVFAAPDGPNEGSEATASMLLSMLDTTRQDIVRMLEGTSARDGVAQQAVAGRLMVRARPEQIEHVRARLLAFLDTLKAECDPEPPEDAVTYGLTLAFYPLPRPQPENERS